MGLRTTHWGPPFWIMIHTIARLWDSKSLFVPDRWKKIFNLLPCHHCRSCSDTFWDEYPHILAHDYNRKFIYLLHEHVNMKLMKQEIHSTNGKKLDDVYRRWFGYQPDYTSILNGGYSINDPIFLNAFGVSLCYILFDRSLAVHVISEFCSWLFPCVPMPPWSITSSRERRVYCIWLYLHGVYNLHSNIANLLSMEIILHKCRFALVSC
jgi:hypothetical protein